MTKLESEVLDFYCRIKPEFAYSQGLEKFRDRIMPRGQDEINRALGEIRNLRRRCPQSEISLRKFLDSLETELEWTEPMIDVGIITDVLSTHMVKEGLNVSVLTKLVSLLSKSLESSINRHSGRKFATPISILTQYQILSATTLLNIINGQTRDLELKFRIEELKKRLNEFERLVHVKSFTDGEFTEVAAILRRDGAEFERKGFYTEALKKGFDYHESPSQLERKALRWLEEDLRKLRRATRKLSRKLGCDPVPESVSASLRSKGDLKQKHALKILLKIRPVIQTLVSELVVKFNPDYDAVVVETPPYLTPIFPTGAAQAFDGFTSHPSQRFYVTTDPRRAPAAGFADLVNLLVHEEYGHCLHFSNTAMSFVASANLSERLSSLHLGTSSEGLSFQRELEFLEALHRLETKKEDQFTDAERKYVDLTNEFGGFEQTLLELDFMTYKNRIVRFLRVIGDVRINTGKQDLLSFLMWGEAKTGLAQRTIYYQLFPAHQSIFPGYATCYAVVGQDIRAIQRQFKNDPEKLSQFNTFATSLGYPPRSVFIKRLRNYAKRLAN